MNISDEESRGHGLDALSRGRRSSDDAICEFLWTSDTDTVFKVPGDDLDHGGDETSLNAPLLPRSMDRSGMMELEELERSQGTGEAGVKGTLMDGIANVCCSCLDGSGLSVDG